MSKQDIIDYVLKTPSNTNPAVLGTMLDEMSGDGESSDLTIATVILMCPEAILSQVGFTGAVCIESYSAMGRTEPLLFPMYSPSQMGMEAKVPLYKGCTVWASMGIPAEYISVTGDITIEVDGQGALLTITGNGTITVTAD